VIVTAKIVKCRFFYTDITSKNDTEEKSTHALSLAESFHQNGKEISTVNSHDIEEKLKFQGYTRVEDPIKFYDDIETFLRKTDSKASSESEPPIPPVRRRSVKDIIESINRNQAKLRVSAPQFERKFDYDGQKVSQGKPLVPPKDKVLLKLSRQMENEKKVNELLADLQNFDNVDSKKESVSKFPLN